MITFPALSRSTKDEAIVTSRTNRGNNEKKALKANAAAHCDPLIPRNLLTARQTIAQTRPPLGHAGSRGAPGSPMAARGCVGFRASTRWHAPLLAGERRGTVFLSFI